MKKRIMAAVMTAALAFAITPSVSAYQNNTSLGQAIADFLTDYINDDDYYYDYTSQLFQLEALSILTSPTGEDILEDYMGSAVSAYREQTADGAVLDEGILRAAAEDMFNADAESIDKFRDEFPEKYYIDEESTGYLVTGQDTEEACRTEVEIYDISSYEDILYVCLHETKYGEESGQQLDEGYKIAVLQSKTPQTGGDDFCISLYYLYDMPDSSVEVCKQMEPMDLENGQCISELLSVDGLPVAGVNGMEAVPPTEGIRYPGMGSDLSLGMDLADEEDTEELELTSAVAYGNGDEGLFIRTDPDDSAEIIGSVPEGEAFYVYDTHSDWGYAVYNDISGWVKLQFVRITDECFCVLSPDDGWTEPAYYTVFNTEGEGLELRSGPSYTFSTFGPVYDGTSVIVYALYGDWGYCLVNGRYGWLHMGYLQYNGPVYDEEAVYYNEDNEEAGSGQNAASWEYDTIVQENETAVQEYDTTVQENETSGQELPAGSELNDRYYELVRENLARFNAMEMHSGCASLDTEDNLDIGIAGNYFDGIGYSADQLKLCRVNDCSKTEAVVAQRNMYFESGNMEMSDDAVRSLIYDQAGNVYMLIAPVDYNLWDLDSINVYAAEDGYIFATADRELGGENVTFSIAFYRVEDFLRMSYMTECS